jgi:hypothetical protein
MKYWQNEETGMCCAVESQPSPRHYEISKEAYDLHESGTTPRAVDVAPATCSHCGMAQVYLSVCESCGHKSQHH